MIKKLVLLLIISLLLASCASTRKAELQKMQKFLDSQVNVMIYDQAIMQWGPPASVTGGEKIFVATWYKEESGIVAMPTPLGGGVYAQRVSSGWVLQLTFDKVTKRMVSWKYKEW